MCVCVRVSVTERATHTLTHTPSRSLSLSCTHTYIHACMYTCMHTYMHAYMHTCIHTFDVFITVTQGCKMDVDLQREKADRKKKHQRLRYHQTKRKAEPVNDHDLRGWATKTTLILQRSCRNVYGPNRSAIMLWIADYHTGVRAFMQHFDILAEIVQLVVDDKKLLNPIQTIFNFMSSCKQLHQQSHEIFPVCLFTPDGLHQRKGIRDQLQRVDRKKLPQDILSRVKSIERTALGSVKSIQRTAAEKKSTNNAKQQYFSRLADIFVDIQQQNISAFKEKLRPATCCLTSVTRSNTTDTRPGSVEGCVTAQLENQVVEAHFRQGQDAGWFPATIVAVSDFREGIPVTVTVKWSDGDDRDTHKRVSQIRFLV